MLDVKSKLRQKEEILIGHRDGYYWERRIFLIDSHSKCTNNSFFLSSLTYEEAEV